MRLRPPAGPRIAAAAALAVTLAVAACGMRTAPRPLEDTAPVIPGEAAASVKGSVIVLRWPRAERSADGQRLDDLSAFIVERRRGEDGLFERIATINVVDQEKIRRRSKFEYRDENPGTGIVSYRVLAVCADGQEGPPTPVASVEVAVSVP